MPAPADATSKFLEYAHPEVLVTADWVAQNLDNPDVVVVESDEDVLLYEIGHIPSAVSVPWGRAVNEDQTFKSRSDLEAIYQGEKGLNPNDEVIAYCRIGERSSHSWFVLKFLLGFDNVRNYDGSWTEWGSLVGVPIVRGEEPGDAPAPRR